MKQVTAMHVSDYFTNKAIDESRPLTVMQTLKLAYMAEGFHLSLEGNSFLKMKFMLGNTAL